MKILLDECFPVDFRHSFPGHEAHTVQWAGLKGKKNGELLDAAEAAGYDVLLMVDQGMRRQQCGDRKLSNILIRSRTNQIEDLSPLASGNHESSRFNPARSGCCGSGDGLTSAALSRPLPEFIVVPNAFNGRQRRLQLF